MKNYKLGFHIPGAALFIMIMLPNWVWFAVPAPNDVLRAASATPILDAIASVCQVLLVAALCFVVRKEGPKPRLLPLGACILLYYLGWAAYYMGAVAPLVILLLTVPPCLAFLLLAAQCRNFAAVVPAVIFSVCHFAHGVVNFM